MRAATGVALAALLLIAPDAKVHGDVLVPGGRFDPLGLKDIEKVLRKGEDVDPESWQDRWSRVPKGFRKVPSEGRVLRGSRGDNGYLTIFAGTTVETDITLPPPPKPDKVAADGWRLLVSVDVLGAQFPNETRLALQIAQGDEVLAERTLVVDRPARSTGEAEGSSYFQPRRVWCVLPADVTARVRAEPITLRLAVPVAAKTFGGGMVVDNLHAGLFHKAPTRALLAKPNGKNGPDEVGCGLLGFSALVEQDRVAFSVLDVRAESPAAEAGLRTGDIVLAIQGAILEPIVLGPGWAWFKHSPEARLGQAIHWAQEGKRKAVSLTLLRAGRPEVRELRLPQRTAFGPAFPGRKDKAGEALYQDVIDWVARHQKENGLWPGQKIVNSSLAGLALLGTRDRTHRKALRRLTAALLKENPTAKETTGFSYWPIAFQGIYLCEYHLATGDKAALTWIRDAIAWLPSTTHPSTWGMPAFGHSPKGLPYDDKALMAPLAHLLVFEALAARCGVEGGIWEKLAPYVKHSWSDPAQGGHGGMGYNASAKDKAQFWARTGLTALALHLQQREPDMVRPMVRFMTERHPWLLNSHAYGEPGGALGLVALATIDPDAFQNVMAQWRWRFACAWEPDFGLRWSTPHMGAPYMGQEEILNPAYGMLFGAVRGGLVLGGAAPKRWLR